MQFLLVYNCLFLSWWVHERSNTNYQAKVITINYNMMDMTRWYSRDGPHKEGSSSWLTWSNCIFRFSFISYISFVEENAGAHVMLFLKPIGTIIISESFHNVQRTNVSGPGADPGVVRVVRSNLLNRKRKHSNLCGFGGKNKWTKKNASLTFVLCKRFLFNLSTW